MFFRLNIESHTTDLVVHELRHPLSIFIDSKRLQVKSFGGLEMADLVLSHATQPKRISLPDCSVLFLTQKLGGILLTGDGNLRHCAERAGVEVRGTLWILDQLVEADLLVRSEAASVLEKMVAEGRRLPVDDCAQRFTLWRVA